MEKNFDFESEIDDLNSELGIDIGDVVEEIDEEEKQDYMSFLSDNVVEKLNIFEDLFRTQIKHYRTVKKQIKDSKIGTGSNKKASGRGEVYNTTGPGLNHTSRQKARAEEKIEALENRIQEDIEFLRSSQEKLERNRAALEKFAVELGYNYQNYFRSNLEDLERRREDFELISDRLEDLLELRQETLHELNEEYSSELSQTGYGSIYGFLEEENSGEEFTYPWLNILTELWEKTELVRNRYEKEVYDTSQLEEEDPSMEIREAYG